MQSAVESNSQKPDWTNDIQTSDSRFLWKIKLIHHERYGYIHHLNAPQYACCIRSRFCSARVDNKLITSIL